MCSDLNQRQSEEIYRQAQEQEQLWREIRRFRGLEELKAKSGGFSIDKKNEINTQKRLNDAKSMFEQGIITDSDYYTMKARIMSGM